MTVTDVELHATVLDEHTVIARVEEASSVRATIVTGGIGPPGQSGGNDPEFVRDTIAAALVAGARISVTVSDPGDTITIAVTGLSTSDLSDFAAAVDERARDALGTALVAGSGVTITPNDVGDTITITATGTGAVDSVNGETGVVVLDAEDVDADPAGTAAALIDGMPPLDVEDDVRDPADVMTVSTHDGVTWIDSSLLATLAEVLPLGALDATWETIEDLEIGVGGGVNARCLVLPLAIDGGYVTVFQCKFEGDDFPRLVVVSDGSYYIGDGTFNPLQTGTGFGACGLIPDGVGGLLLVSNGVRFKLPASGASEIRADSFTLKLGGGSPVAIFASSGDPNGSITAVNPGDLCVDYSNGLLWQAPLPGTVWRQVSAILRNPVLPADGELNPSDLTFGLDDTPGSTALHIKAKDSAGTVRTATVPLS